jgi:hypothetical protein
MTRGVIALAEGGIHRDFEADLLAYLQKHDARMHGCPVWKIESKIDGSLAIWFKGLRCGVEWSGAFKFNFPDLKAKHLLCNVEACGDTALKLIDHHGIRYDNTPLIQRAQAN